MAKFNLKKFNRRWNRKALAIRGAASYARPRLGRGQMRIMRSVGAGKVYNFKRMALTPSFTTSGITVGTNAAGVTKWTVAKNTVGSATTIAQLSDVQGNTELTAMFDQYKINCVVYEIAYRCNFADSTLANSQLPYLVYAYDDDDSSVATEAALMEYNTTRKFYFGNGARRAVKIKLKPKINLLGNDGVTNYGVQLPGRKAGWVDCAVPNIRHFGVKLVIVNDTPAVTGVDQEFDVSAKYYLTFKTLR